MGKKIRRELNINDVFSKFKYRDIIYFIWRYQDKKIGFLHLRYALCENHCIKKKTSIAECEKFFKKNKSKKEKYFKELKKDFEDGWFDKKAYDDMKKSWKDSELDQYWNDKNYTKYFTTPQSLENALRRIKKIGIIDSNNGNYFYTDYGFAEGYKRAIYHKIDYFIRNYCKDLSDKETLKYMAGIYSGVTKVLINNNKNFISSHS